MAYMQIESIRVHLHPDGQTSGTRSARLVGIGSCVRFETDDDSSVGLVRGFKYDEGVLHGKLQVFEGASDVLPISQYLRLGTDDDHELIITNSCELVPVKRFLCLAQVVDGILWQRRYVDSPATPVAGVHYFVNRHFNTTSRQLTKLRRPFVAGSHPFAGVMVIGPLAKRAVTCKPCLNSFQRV